MGYDGTAFDRQEAALIKLAYDAEEQRSANENSSRGPHVSSRNLELAGTELRDLFLDHQIRESEFASASRESPVLMQDAYIGSWARRYSRAKPMWVIACGQEC